MNGIPKKSRIACVLARIDRVKNIEPKIMYFFFELFFKYFIKKKFDNKKNKTDKASDRNKNNN